jgi:hypothetical protein
LEKRSVDIQRLTKPLVRKDGEAVANPFAFGGGLRHGGLSEEAIELLAPIMGFDYMGASEFEFGALPKAMQKMIDGGKLVVFAIEIKTGKGKHCWKDEQPGVLEDTVYVLCPEAWEAEVKKRIHKFAEGEDMQQTRERVCLERSIRQRAKGEREPSILGWIEINNGYMFFIDEEMWRKTAAVFGVDC